ncbi:MAG: ATPase, P-type (transporting), superfamily, subfamily, partial [Polaromonas sp.]|nr:ATPase, P-type (transporting), superfamily, subfamily [Polaromonas sp.]
MGAARRSPPLDLAALCARLANLNDLRMPSTLPEPASVAPSSNPPATPWHALPAGQVLDRLACEPATGLSTEEADRRRAQGGANTLPEPPRRSALAMVARQFTSPLIYILFAAAVLAIALSHHGDAVVILMVVLANALIGAFQEGRAERSMASLRQLSALHVRVLRGGHEAMIAARDLVAGDMLLLAAGDAVGADARLIEAARLQVAEAALTGESVPVSKATGALCEATGLADRRNMVFSGTYATAGRGRAVVVAIGAQTEVGRIAGMTENALDPKTPLEQRIGQFGRWLVAAALLLFVAVIALGLYRELPLADVLMVAISQMVSMVPEGLPVAMTIALAVGMQRMAGRGAIIRRLSAVETLGSTTVICTDKTGTLTRNEMTVSRLWLPGG